MPHATPCIAFPTEIVNIVGLKWVILRGNRLESAFVSGSSRPKCVGADACGA
jgi:hypothetical protein